MSLTVSYSIDFKCNACGVRFVVKLGDVNSTPPAMPQYAQSRTAVDGTVTITPGCPLCGERSKDRSTLVMAPP